MKKYMKLLIVAAIFGNTIYAKEMYVICKKSDSFLYCQEKLDFVSRIYLKMKKLKATWETKALEEKDKKSYYFENAIKHGWRVAYKELDELGNGQIHIKKNIKRKKKR